MIRRFALALLATLTLGLFGASTALALPAHAVKATVLVPAGLTPDDVHIQFTGTGGTIAGPTAQPDAGDGNPNVTGVSGGGNTVDVTWDNKLAPADPVEIRFTCQHAVIGVAGGTWTNGGNVIGNVQPGDVTVTIDPADPVPGASPFVMALIAMAVAAGGVLMLRRRAEAQA